GPGRRLRGDARGRGARHPPARAPGLLREPGAAAGAGARDPSRGAVHRRRIVRRRPGRHDHRWRRVAAPGAHDRRPPAARRAAHRQHGPAARVAPGGVPPGRVPRYGILEPEGEISPIFRVRGIVEKPAPEAAPSRQAIAARYVFSPEIFTACREVAARAQGELQLTDAMTWLARAGRPVLAVCLDPTQRRLDIGNPASYFAAFAAKAR